jgi:orotidine-5'-phosphate decarboxylase
MPTQLIVALDVDRQADAERLVDQAGDAVTWFKIGKQLFTRCGPPIVARLKDAGKRVFLDLKFHDIPNTVHQAVAAAIDIGADIVNVHASGGLPMLEAAAKARRGDALVIAVTVLTSIDEPTFHGVGFFGTIADQVARLARLAQQAGLDGVVASGRESALIRATCGAAFVQVIPGIRPATAGADDQQRTMTPGDAARAGAHYIVVGRPVTHAPSPGEAARAILAELAAAQSGRQGGQPV